jgi:putative zinc finger protein
VISPRCLVVQSQLGRFVDSALSAEEAGAVRDHLELCIRCREAERVAGAIPFMLSSSFPPPAPATLLPKVLGALKHVWRRERIERRTTATVAAMVLIVAAGTVVDGRAQPRTSQAASGRTTVLPQSPDTSLAATRSTPSLGSGPATHLTPVNLHPTSPPSKTPARCSSKRGAGASASRSANCGGAATPQGSPDVSFTATPSDRGSVVRNTKGLEGFNLSTEAGANRDSGRARLR